MAQRFRSALSDSHVAIALGTDAIDSLRSDSRQLQFFSEYLGQFGQRNVHLQDMGTRLGPPRANTVTFPYLVALFALALADAVLGVGAIAKLRCVNAVDRDADEVLALLANQLPACQEMSQFLANLSLNDLTESLVVLFNLQNHTRNRPLHPVRRFRSESLNL